MIKKERFEILKLNRYVIYDNKLGWKVSTVHTNQAAIKTKRLCIKECGKYFKPKK